MLKLENKEYDIKGRTTCDCGYEFTINDMQQLTRINQPGFYGNVVKHYSKAKCPKCGKEVILLLKQVGQTYKILDIASKKVTNSNENNAKEDENVENEPKTAIEGEKQNSNEFICQICGKVCKSQIGLNSHLKTHQN